ncbi:MAG: hypothetical protein ABL967_09025 [Bryobacteraceae bacterium]
MKRTMNSGLMITPLAASWVDQEFDLAIATVGYEERARHIFSALPPSARVKAACGFDSQQVFEYENNSAWFQSNRFDVAHLADDDYGEWIQGALNRVDTDGNPIKVLVDISSTTRVRMAKLLVALKNFTRVPIAATFVYSLASFTAPPTERHANSHVGPVTPEFAGWWEEPDRALVAVVGLGYEQDKALGAVEHLQAAEIWTFMPASEVSQFSPALLRANRTLLESVPPHQQMDYRVQDPFDCFAKLESLVYGLSQTKNAVLLPFGPKLFSLASLLVALLYPELPVWRVSAEQHEQPVNRKASGFVYGLEVAFK